MRSLRVHARPALVIAVVIAVSAGATAAAAVVAGLVADTPAPPLGWSVNGAATPIAAGFQLTRAGRFDTAGSAFWNTPVSLQQPLSIAFDATMSGGGTVGADGMTLVFADSRNGGGPHVAGERASALGYGGIPGVAVTLDTYENTREPSSNFVGIATGLDDDGVPITVARTTDVPDLRATVRHVQVDVTNNHLAVTIDGRAVLASDVTLPAQAYVGFTASTGGYTDDHLVTNIRADNASGIGSIGSGAAPPVTLPPAVTPGAPSTTQPTAPSSPRNAPPPAAGYFTMLPPGSALPSDAECAARVHRSPWEPRPENTTANHTTPPATVDLGSFSQWNAAWNADYRTRIDGDFTGTTDEIAQWAACKWGWSDNLVRAQMVQESTWRQSTKSDLEPRSRGHCVYDDTSDPCPTSFSIIQVKWYFHPQVGSSSSPQSSYPWIARSTAFALDLELAEMRGCYDGMSTYLGNTKGDYLGCLQYWFSGSWTPGGGSYAASVSSHLAAEAWRSWAG